MLLGGILLGLLAGLLAGGRVDHLVRVRLRWLPLLFGAIVLRFLTDGLVAQNIGPIDALRLPLYTLSYGLLAVALWLNRRHPGLSLAMVGVLANGIAIVGNGGFMPVWARSLEAAGFDPATATSSFHVVLPASLDASFLLHAGPISDLLPIPVPLIQSVASIGDVFLAFGLSFFLFATLVRAPGELEQELSAIAAGYRGSAGLRGRPDPRQTDRGLTLSSSGSGALAAAFPADGFPTGPVPWPISAVQAPTAAFPVPTTRQPLPAPLERLRDHPYIRLALNGSYSAMWIGQLISLFGDRVNQIALAFLVYAASGHSAIAVAFVFVFATVPNLLLGPIAGTAVDRWDQKQVMIVSDLLRASIVLLVPIAAVTNILLVYPLIFLVTSISIFFRPARAAVTPRIVLPDELMTANSAAWVGETLADVVGYPIAGVFVAFLGAALPLAFWIDSATYTASALLVASMTIPALRRMTSDAAGEGEDGSEGKRNRFVADMLQGWHFLRREPVLLANTLQGAAGQFMTGAVTALTPIYVATVLAPTAFGNSGAYAFVEMAIGIGNLVGGFAVGLIGARLARGRMVIVGYTVAGLGTAFLALTAALPVAIGLAAGVGVANMVFVIPSQTLFQERTPADMIGRVVGMRFSLVFGSMTLAMALSGVVAGVIGVAPVFFVTGLLCAAAGLGGLLIPAVREA